MAAEAICDGCGKREPMCTDPFNFHIPLGWYQCATKNGTQVACSRECVTKVIEKTGKRCQSFNFEETRRGE